MIKHDEAPTDLLLGLLARRAGLIDGGRFHAALDAWNEAKERTLAQILAEQGSIDDETCALLHRMAVKQLAIHGGSAERSFAALAEVETRPVGGPAADEATVSIHLHPGAGAESPTTATGAAVGGGAGDGQRFEVVNLHAQGGLGAVYVARDRELNRDVALKQMLDYHADDPERRARFLQEAEITGGLEHPGIVPVYGLGRYPDGRPYYAMRFIRGESLKEAIAAFHADPDLKADPGKRSLALRKLLRRFVDVCNAMDYAHGRGVLHRDLKPANIIVGKYGETLVVDWGLAKSIGRDLQSTADGEATLVPTAGDSTETLPGTAMGTPAYMSPEQARGDHRRVSHRSDVYSLGATLYCLLTGKAPYEGRDIGSILRRIGQGDFPPPRRLDPTIDRALEAICLKAMTVEPEGRYRSVRNLADDVERWAADEPVLAYREPFAVRAARWRRRHRSTVTATVTAVMAVFIGLAGFLLVQARANHVLASKNYELAAANAREAAANADLRQANVVALNRFDLAREAIRSFQGAVTQDEMLKGAGLKGLRNKLLRSAADFYQKLEVLLLDQPDGPSRAMLAQSYYELGDLTEQIGSPTEALTIHRKALALRRELSASPGGDAEIGLDLTRSLIAVGLLVEATSDIRAALEAFRQAQRLAGSLAAHPRLVGEARKLHGMTFKRVGRIFYKLGDLSAALAATEQALAIWRDHARDDPSVELRYEMAGSYLNLHHFHWQVRHRDLAGEMALEALRLTQGLVSDHPESSRYRTWLAIAEANLAEFGLDIGADDQALTSATRALEVQGRLVADFPAVADHRKLLGRYHHLLALCQARAGRAADALASHREAIRIQGELVAADPLITEPRIILAQSHRGFGRFLYATGNPAAALAEYDQAETLLRQLIRANPTDLEVRGQMAGMHADVGDADCDLARTAAARTAYDGAIVALEQLMIADPESVKYRKDLARAVRRLGLLEGSAGEPAAATAAARRALDLLGGLPTRSGDDWYEAGCAEAMLAGPTADGPLAADRAIADLRRAIADGFRDAAAFRRDPGLDPIRGRPDFAAIALDLALPNDPFRN